MSLGDLWTTAAADHEGDHQRRMVIAARTQCLPVWPFLAAATSVADFVNRKSLVADRIDAACQKLTEGNPAAFAVLRNEVDASLDADFRILYEAVQAEQQRVNAPRMFERNAARKEGALDDGYYVALSGCEIIQGPFPTEIEATSAMEDPDLTGYSHLRVHPASDFSAGYFDSRTHFAAYKEAVAHNPDRDTEDSGNDEDYVDCKDCGRHVVPSGRALPICNSCITKRDPDYFTRRSSLHTAGKEYTIRRDPLNGNKWQVKVKQQPGGPGTEPMWFDAGDACETEAEARAKMEEFKKSGASERIHPSDRQRGVCETCGQDVIEIEPGWWLHTDKNGMNPGNGGHNPSPKMIPGNPRPPVRGAKTADGGRSSADFEGSEPAVHWKQPGEHNENTSHSSNTPEGGTHNGPRSNCPICASKTATGDRWQYTDARGVTTEGTLESIVDLGGHDISYHFRRDDGGKDIVSGARIKDMQRTSKTAGVVLDESWSEDDRRKLLAGMAEFDKLNAEWLEGFHLGRRAATSGSITASLIAAGIRGGLFESGFEDGYNVALRQEAFRKGAPFAGYADFDACVAANKDKNDPEAYCGYIKHKVEDKKSSRKTAGETSTCVHCGRPIEDDDGIWFHPDTMSARCDGPDDEPGIAWSDLVRQAEPVTAARKVAAINWEPIYSLGVPNENYLEGTYKGMHCELFYNNRLGHGPMAWDWSFYDDDSGDPDLAVARSDNGFPTKEAAEADLVDYIDGYKVSSRRVAAHTWEKAKVKDLKEGDVFRHVNNKPSPFSAISDENWDNAVGSGPQGTKVKETYDHQHGRGINNHVYDPELEVEVARHHGARIATEMPYGAQPDAGVGAGVGPGYCPNCGSNRVTMGTSHSPSSMPTGAGGVSRMGDPGHGDVIGCECQNCGTKYMWSYPARSYVSMLHLAGDPPWLNKGKDGDDKKDAKPSPNADDADKDGKDDEGQQGADDPSMMQPGQQVTLHYQTTGDNAQNGDCPATFENFDGTTATFKYEKGTFGVTNANGKWIDSAGTEFTFSAGTAADPNQQQQAPQQPAQTPPNNPVQSNLEMVVTRPDGSRIGTKVVLDEGTALGDVVRQSYEAIARHPHMAAEEFQIGDHVRINGGFEDGITGVIVANEPKTGEEISQMSGNPTVGYDRPYRYRIKVDGGEQTIGGVHPINLEKIGSRRTASIVTEDGKTVNTGDRVFNYYDGWWGTIGEIDSEGWFPLKGDDGQYAILNGQRVAVDLPRGNPLYDKWEQGRR